jgi:Predicted membrane protein (DUF2339)
MEDSFILLALVIAGVVLTVPVLAIIALLRTKSLSMQLEQQATDHRDEIYQLRREIAELRRIRVEAPPPTRTESAPTVQAAPQVEEPRAARYGTSPDAPAMRQTPPVAADTSLRDLLDVERTQAVAAPSQTIAPVPPQPSIPPASPAPPLVEAPAPIQAAHGETPATQPPAPKTPVPAEVPAAARIGQTSRIPSPPQAAPPPVDSFGTPAWAWHSTDDEPPRKSWAERLRATLPLEEILGMNLFAKIGMVLLVLGFALLGRVALVAMGPAGKVALLYAAAGTLLGGGIWLERKERYRLIGRAGIGGGWALLFFTTFAMWHVPAMRVMDSLTLNCALLLAVAVAMVLHTLRYQSQLVTGFAFLLAFSTVALGQDTVYSLSSGVILALGIVIICLRMRWFELEIFGILASFANHFYWLYKLYPGGVAGHAFPQFWPSCVILVLYWLTFRISYIARGVRSEIDERSSSIAAVLNTTLLLAVMKFQSTRPELAFYALLALGALEFFFGQLPVTRRRRIAFIVLTVLGSLLMLAAVPFKFSGNSIALLWMIAAEALLVAGIVQREIVFRRIALATGIATGALVVWKAASIVEFRQHSETPLVHNGVLLLACSVLFFANTHFFARRWKELFDGLDHILISIQSYIGGITIFLGSWALITGDWTAVAWAALMLGAAFAGRRLASRHQQIQAWLFCGVATLRIAIFNSHFTDLYPHHVAGRLITLPILAALFYLTAALTGSEDLSLALRTLTLWTGSGILAALSWFEVSPLWVAPVWMAFGLALVLVRSKIRLSDFSVQEHVLAVAVTGQLIFFNLQSGTSLTAWLPILLCAAALYGVSRFSALSEAGWYRLAAYAHTWAATGLLAALAWRETSQPWLAPCWILFALALAVADRLFGWEELTWQAQALAALAIARTVWVNLFLTDRWQGIDTRLLTVSVVVLGLYALAQFVRMPQQWRNRSLHHAWSWAGSVLAAWMLWSELSPNAVAVGIAIFGVALFEWGMIQKQRPLRLQAYAALTAAFGRIFFVNLTAVRLPGAAINPAIATVLPIAAIFFYLWMRLRSTQAEPRRLPIQDLMACYGTGCVVALLYFQVNAEWVATAWAATALALLATVWLLRDRVFLYQSFALVAGTTARSLAHNIYGADYFTTHGWNGNFAVVLGTVLLLLAALPIAFPLRARYASEPSPAPLTRLLGLDHPEQWFFFAPVVLLVFLIAVRMNPGMITLSWGVEGLLVILLGLAAGQRSYRLTGLLLLLLCVAKIVFLDAWRLEERDRYITFIVLGAALTLVSMLYNRYRETLRRLL